MFQRTQMNAAMIAGVTPSSFSKETHHRQPGRLSRVWSYLGIAVVPYSPWSKPAARNLSGLPGTCGRSVGAKLPGFGSEAIGRTYKEWRTCCRASERACLVRTNLDSNSSSPHVELLTFPTDRESEFCSNLSSPPPKELPNRYRESRLSLPNFQAGCRQCDGHRRESGRLDSYYHSPEQLHGHCCLDRL